MAHLILIILLGIAAYLTFRLVQGLLKLVWIAVILLLLVNYIILPRLGHAPYTIGPEKEWLEKIGIFKKRARQDLSEKLTDLKELKTKVNLQ